MQTPHSNPSKYKTILCKHFTSQRGCFFGDNCQFAHGLNDLRTNPNLQNISSENKKGPNLQNYKIVKCKYWEKDGTCRYGTLCTFAHGDNELRKKSENIALIQNDLMNNQLFNTKFNPFVMGFNNNNFNNNFDNENKVNNFYNENNNNFIGNLFTGDNYNNSDNYNLVMDNFNENKKLE